MEDREYLARLRAIKPVILSDSDLVGRIHGTFGHQYLGHALPQGSQVLGRGDSNLVYGVGSIENPTTGETLWLALRLCHAAPQLVPTDLSTAGISILLQELSSYEGAFMADRNPPYFAGLVRVPVWDKSLQHAGIITEDISKGNSLILRSVGDEEVIRTNPDGSEEFFYVDPLWGGDLPSINSGVYLGDTHRVDIDGLNS